MKIDDRHNIKMTRGDSETITISCREVSLQSGERSEIPFENGDQIAFTVRKTAVSKEKLIEKIVTEFEEGKAVIEIASEDTAEMKFGSYLYDIQLKRANGTITTLIGPAAFGIGEEVSWNG